jgi:hypothetical protein
MPSKRPSRRFIPRPSHGRSRRDSRPNVYIQPEKTDASAEGAAAPRAAGANGAGAGPTGGGAVVTARRRPARARVGAARAEVFTRTLSRELRQLGLLTVASVVVVVALAVALK